MIPQGPAGAVRREPKDLLEHLENLRADLQLAGVPWDSYVEDVNDAIAALADRVGEVGEAPARVPAQLETLFQRVTQARESASAMGRLMLDLTWQELDLIHASLAADRHLAEVEGAGRPAPPLADSQDERLIHALRLVRSVIDELAEDVCGDDVTPELRGQPTPFGQFDAGHLCAAETLIGGHLSEDASARYAKEDEHRRWQNVVKTIVSHQASSEFAGPALVAEGAPRDWHPIETAPREQKRVVLLYGEEYGRRIWGQGYYFKGVPGDGEGWITSSFYTEPENDMRGTFTPTHWMPLPSPPSAEGAPPPSTERKA